MRGTPRGSWGSLSLPMVVASFPCSVPWLFGFFRPGRLIMSNDPAAPSRGNKVRWIITGGLLVLAVLCVGWIVWLWPTGPLPAGSPLEEGDSHVSPAFTALYGVVLIGVGVWILRPP